MCYLKCISTRSLRIILTLVWNLFLDVIIATVNIFSTRAPEHSARDLKTGLLKLSISDMLRDFIIHYVQKNKEKKNLSTTE